MLVFTVSQLLEMSLDSVPESFTGKITKVFPPNDSSKKNPPPEKPYFMQKLVITDGAKEIEVMFDARQEVPRAYEGCKLQVVAGRGEKGLKGTKRKANVWRERTTQQVWVYDSAEVAFEAANGSAVTQPAAQTAAQPAQDPASRTAAPAPQPSNDRQPAANGNHNGYTSSDASKATDVPTANARTSKEVKDAARLIEIKSFDKRVAKTTAAYHRCVDAAMKAIADINKRHGTNFVPTLEVIEKMAMGFMVNACWTAKPADIENFPMKPFAEYTAPVAANGVNGNGNGHAQVPAGAPFN